MKTAIETLLFSMALTGSPANGDPKVDEILAAPEALVATPFTQGGRAPAGDAANIVYDWPGTHFDTAFQGDRVYFKVGAGHTTLRVIVDGHTLAVMVNPTPGYYEIDDLRATAHHLRIEAATERQAEPAHFAGFYLMPGEEPLK